MLPVKRRAVNVKHDSYSGTVTRRFNGSLRDRRTKYVVRPCNPCDHERQERRFPYLTCFINTLLGLAHSIRCFADNHGHAHVAL